VKEGGGAQEAGLRACEARNVGHRERDAVLMSVVHAAFEMEGDHEELQRLRMRAYGVHFLLTWPNGKRELMGGAPSKDGDIAVLMASMAGLYKRRAIFQEFRRGGKADEWEPEQECRAWESVATGMGELASQECPADAQLEVLSMGPGEAHLMNGHEALVSFGFVTLAFLALQDEENALRRLETAIGLEETFVKRWLGSDADVVESHRRCATMGKLIGQAERVSAWLPSMVKAARKVS
jgi:hypothetical protein